MKMGTQEGGAAVASELTHTEHRYEGKEVAILDMDAVKHLRNRPLSELRAYLAKHHPGYHLPDSKFLKHLNERFDRIPAELETMSGAQYGNEVNILAVDSPKEGETGETTTRMKLFKGPDGKYTKRPQGLDSSSSPEEKLKDSDVILLVKNH
jgi:hypothetical protein